MSALLAIMCMLTTVTPAMAAAYPVDGDFKMVVSNHYNKIKGDANLVGAEYEFYQTHTMEDSGKLIKNEKEKLLDTKKLTKESDSITFTAKEAGEYKLLQTKRPDGYYLGQGFEDAAKKKPLDKVIVDFPLVEGGKLKADQVQKVQPKFIKVEIPLEFQKLDAKGKPMKNVEFELYQMDLHKNATEEELANNGKIIGETVTDNEGMVKFESLLQEGKYVLHETPKQKGYGEKYIAFELKAKAGKEDTASKIEDFEFVGKDFDGKTYKNIEVPTGTNEKESEDPEFDGAPFYKEVKNETSDYAQTVEAGVGEKVIFKLNFKTPEDIKNYTKFEGEEKLAKEFTLISNDIKVYSEKGESKDFDIEKSEDGFTFKAKDCKDLIPNTKYYIEVKVKLNETAEHNKPVKNNLVITYNNGDLKPNGDPVDDVTTDIPEDKQPEVIPTLGELTVTARDGEKPDNLLPDVVFTLEEEVNGKWKPVPDVELKTGENGKISLPNLSNGKYRLINKEVPDGYRRNTEKKEFTIDRENSRVNIVYDIYKPSGFFPSTGTKGMLPFVIAGLLVGITGMYVMTSKRKKEEIE